MNEDKRDKTTEAKEPQKERELPIFTWCSIELDNSDFSRRCFMSGEFCSRQGNVKRERRELHEKNRIRAFVDMSYSNISDVLYKWRIKTFIESLKNRLYFNKRKTRLYCIDLSNLSVKVLESLINEECTFETKQNQDGAAQNESHISENSEKSWTNRLMCLKAKGQDATASECKRLFQDHFVWKGNNSTSDAFFIPVSEIEVIRADSDPSTNFVICNRVCQQMQISDLIVADVTVENANVFYELGMAVALSKMVLPICYSERYYEAGPKNEEQKKEQEKPFEHHIDCFPLRRMLFEHFGIRFRNDSYTKIIRERRSGNNIQQEDPYKWETCYLPFADVTQPSHGFSDVKYDMFPYLDEWKPGQPGTITQQEASNRDTNEAPQKGKETIGQHLYNKLSISYNHATYDENTLVLYTMDSIINETQAAHCIINYYQSVVRQFRELHCFQGERVCVLLQSNEIPEDPKDGSKDRPLRYSAGEIIQIGVNQATYKAHMELIKPDEFLDRGAIESYIIEWEERFKEKHEDGTTNETEEQRKEWWEASLRNVKEFVRNRAIPIYSDNPVYVKRFTDGLQEDIFDDISLDSTNYTEDDNRRKKAQYFFSLYHVMLRTLRYTNELVVDISTNSLQSFFWLGAAHASETSAITIRRDESDIERQMLNRSSEPRKRGIFDVAGLWTAVYATNATESFYEQLAKAQSGIESRSRLVLQNRNKTENQLREDFWNPNPKNITKGIQALHEKKEIQEDRALESYYRNYFWRRMLRYNRLSIYLLKTMGVVEDDKVKRQIVPEWDVEAVGLLSDYLSKKAQIGEYRIKPLQENEKDKTTARVVNNISFGKRAVIEYENSHSPKKLTFENSHIDVNTVEILDPQVKEGIYPKIKNGTYKIITAHLVIQHKTAQEVSSRPSGTNSLPKSRDYFMVYIAGESGPATKALASIFVDDDVYDLCGDKSELKLPCEKSSSEERILSEEKKGEIKKRRFPLQTLQKDLRDKFLKDFCKRLKQRFEVELGILFAVKSIQNEAASSTEKNLENDKKPTIGQVKDYYQKVTNIALLYLSTVLYRYFLPLLSEKDINRICNGMNMLICSLRAANRSPFALKYEPHTFDNYLSVIPDDIIQAAAKMVLDALASTLENFCEIQVSYSVAVKDPSAGSGENDNREILGIIQKDGSIRTQNETPPKDNEN